MKKIITLMLAIILVLGLSACGEASEALDNTSGKQPTNQAILETEQGKSDERQIVLSEQSDNVPGNETPSTANSGSDVLVAVFSATGTTRGVAEKIAAIENADLYEIVPAQAYTDADLNYNDSSSRATKEQNDPSVRPEIESEQIDLSGYTKIYIGYPIWWGQEPRIMDTFVENYDFGDATVIPFCTSGSSGIGKSGTNLADLAGSGIWLDGKRFSGTVTEDELKDWIDGLQ